MSCFSYRGSLTCCQTLLKNARVRKTFSLRLICHSSSTDVCTTIRGILQSAITQPYDEEICKSAKIDIVPTQNAKFGDYQCSAAFSIASALRKPPRDIANTIVAAIKCGDVLESVSVAGGGFINMTLSPAYIASSILRQAKDHAHLGVTTATVPQTIVIDYSSPNIAKEMHVGHLRSTIIGDCLGNVFEYLGYKVVRLNHVGDWGTQFGMLLHYLQTKQVNIHAMTLPELMAAYQAARKLYDSDENFAAASRAMVVRLQNRETQIINSWNQICSISRDACNYIYSMLNVTKLQERGESFYASMCNSVVQDLLEAGVATKSDGAVVILPENNDLIPLIIRKSDGSYLYATSDLAALKHRFSVEGAAEVLYVTDSGQAKHFESVFSAAQRAGYITGSVKHVPFGVVLGEDGKKLKTRSGETVRLIDLLEESIVRAKATILTRSHNLSESEQESVARVIGIGAVKYADLSMHREGAYKFSYDKMLAFSGNTAPYLLYAYVRIQSISRKADMDVSSVQKLHLVAPEEIALAKQLLKFESVLIDIASNFYTHKVQR